MSVPVQGIHVGQHVLQREEQVGGPAAGIAQESPEGASRPRASRGRASRLCA